MFLQLRKSWLTRFLVDKGGRCCDLKAVVTSSLGKEFATRYGSLIAKIALQVVEVVKAEADRHTTFDLMDFAKMEIFREGKSIIS